MRIILVEFETLISAIVPSQVGPGSLQLLQLNSQYLTLQGTVGEIPVLSWNLQFTMVVLIHENFREILSLK
jgi:hypothetical protein